jgi:hypothetical protein
VEGRAATTSVAEKMRGQISPNGRDQDHLDLKILEEAGRVE